MSSTGKRCPNCGGEAPGRYCPDCGQARGRGRLSVRRLAGDYLQQLLDLDTSLLRTLRSLLRDPGGTARDYVAGRRTRLVNPLRFFLGASALFLLVHRLSGLDLDSGLGFGLAVTGSESEAERVAAMLQFMRDQLDFVLVLALPVYGIAQRLLFWRAHYNYAETLVLLFYVQGLLFAYGTLLFALAPLEPRLLPFLRLVLHLVTIVWAIRGFYGSRRWVAAILGIASTACYLLIVAFIAAAVLVLAGRVA